MRLPVNTVIHTTLVGLEPATFRSLVDCWSDALPVLPRFMLKVSTFYLPDMHIGANAVPQWDVFETRCRLPSVSIFYQLRYMIYSGAKCTGVHRRELVVGDVPHYSKLTTFTVLHLLIGLQIREVKTQKVYEQLAQGLCCSTE